MDSDGDSSDFDADYDSDDDTDDADYEYDEDGDPEMEFEVECDESDTEFAFESDEDADVEHDQSGTTTEGTWQITHGDSNDIEIGYPYDAGGEPDETESESHNSGIESGKEGDPEHPDDGPDAQAYYDGRGSLINYVIGPYEGQPYGRLSRHTDDKGRGTHNQDERKRSRYSRPEPDYYSDYEEEYDEEEEDEEECEDTPWDRLRRMARSIITFTPMGDDDA